MLKLRSWSAALSSIPAVLTDLDRVCTREPPGARQTESPASLYAMDAVDALGLPDLDPFLFCLSGPVGSSLQLMKRACDPATGLLVGEGFPRRARRMHPFTLLLSLQNQVAATLSLHFGWKRACMNGLDEPTTFVDLLPSMEIKQPEGPVLVVASSAAGRLDDREWMHHSSPGCTILEGAIALLFDEDGAVAEISSADATQSATPVGTLFDDRLAAPGLEAALACLSALARGVDREVFQLEAAGRRACFEWNKA